MNDPTIGTHEANKRMCCELGDCVNSKQKETQENTRYDRIVRMNNCSSMLKEETKILILT
jgi:hypothetical protein